MEDWKSKSREELEGILNNKFPKYSPQEREEAKSNIVKEVVESIIAEGGSPSETTSEKIISKARKILGGGVELRGGGRAVMKKGGKV